MPALDLTTIGAGGGSIVWINEGGLLSLGPLLRAHILGLLAINKAAQNLP